MCDGVIIDAHLIPQIRHELNSGGGVLNDIISWILVNCRISVTDYVETHWKKHCPDRYTDFWEWYFQQLVAKRINFISKEKLRRLDSRIFMQIRKHHGLPRDCFIKAYLDCANSVVDPKYILTEDIYFYEPTAKKLTSTKQKEIIKDRSGTLCRYLERTLKLCVGCPSNFKSSFVDKGPCPNKPSTHLNPCTQVP